jgi:hypothetical protein
MKQLRNATFAGAPVRQRYPIAHCVAVTLIARSPRMTSWVTNDLEVSFGAWKLTSNLASLL